MTTSTPAVSPLRQRMIDDTRMRKMEPKISRRRRPAHAACVNTGNAFATIVSDAVRQIRK